jgi:hypothetical protein
MLRLFGYVFAKAVWPRVPRGCLATCSPRLFGHVFPEAVWPRVPWGCLATCSPRLFGHVFPAAVWPRVPRGCLATCSPRLFGHVFPEAVWPRVLRGCLLIHVFAKDDWSHVCFESAEWAIIALCRFNLPPPTSWYAVSLLSSALYGRPILIQNPIGILNVTPPSFPE